MKITYINVKVLFENVCVCVRIRVRSYPHFQILTINQTDKLYSLGSIPFLLITRTLCLSKLSYGQTQRLFGQQMGQLETVETETESGKWKTEMVKSSYERTVE